MLRAGRCYEEFEEAAELAIRTCTTAAEECRRKEREVRRRKEATKVVGTGLTAIGTVVASTMGYLVAGPVGSFAMGVMAGGGGGRNLFHMQDCTGFGTVSENIQTSRATV